MKLVIGLGNPGKKYSKTRHNAGFLALDALAAKLGVFWTPEKDFKADLARAFVKDERVVLAKPTTFMNLSGQAAVALMNFYKTEPNDVLIVQDDMDHLPGQMNFIPQGGDAGHNGIASIFELTGRRDFTRLRLGIGRPIDKEIKSEDWVLGNLQAETLKATDEAPDAILDWITQGPQKAMTKWNAR
jgi:PTH1 family peptidyl-tRNA hydrolase